MARVKITCCFGAQIQVVFCDQKVDDPKQQISNKKDTNDQNPKYNTFNHTLFYVDVFCLH